MKDWRDVNMTVTMQGVITVINGPYKYNRRATIEFPAKQVHENAQQAMLRNTRHRPHWKNDPTYDLKQVKKLLSEQ